jgi:predicted lipid-binding transport protein (Tim44 family)
MKILRNKARVLLYVFFLLTALFWLGMDSEAFARAGGGRSSGSTGSSSGKSYSRPAPPPSQPPATPQQTQTPTAPAGAGRSFLSGMAGGVMGGLLGGMLFRSLGFADSGAEGGGFGFGDLLLIMVILTIIYFVYKRFRSRNTMQMSAAGAGSYSYQAPTPTQGYAPPALEAGTEDSKLEGLRHIREMDPSFNEKDFKDLSEDIFFKIQAAWTKRDLSNVRQLLSQEMFNVFQQDVNRMLAEKQINRLENIAVREVEIVEAGQKRGEEFVTARFYANLLDYTADDKTGQIISGSSSAPVKFVEYWTFSRNVGEKNWVLAGISQETNH